MSEDPTEEAGGRERLLAAAVPLFAAKGYAATTVRDIVGAAGVTLPVLYYHFGNKEGLFVALARQGKERFDEVRNQALREGGTAAERLRRLCRVDTQVRREFADLARVVDQLLSGPPESAPPVDFRAMAQERVRLLEGIVEEGVATGEFRPCSSAHVVLALLGVIDVATRSHLYGIGRGTSEEQLEGMLDVILAGISAPSD